MHYATILNIMRFNFSIHGVMPHSFKTISMVSGGGGLTLEGLRGLCIGRDDIF